MSRTVLRIFFTCCIAFAGLGNLWAQTIQTDSGQFRRVDSVAAPKQDSAAVVADTVKPYIKPEPDTSLQAFYHLNPVVAKPRSSFFRQDVPFAPRERDLVFYILTGLLLVLGLIRLVFAKYFNDLFRIFFQTSIRQKSIREQLLQNTTASLVMNVFFCISSGLFLFFVATYKGWLSESGLVEKGLLCVALIAGVYTVKFVGLRLSGWLFGMAEVTETYLFIVFLINKIVGVLIFPAVVILALGSESLQPILLVATVLMLIILYFYRYIIALPLVRNSSGLTGFHFFIYLCAFEVVPVLLIYKSLLLVLGR